MLNYYSAWPFFLEAGLLFALVSTPLFRTADSPPIAEKSRIEEFDGLRGFLALSIFFHHTACISSICVMECGSFRLRTFTFTSASSVWLCSS